MTINRIKTIFYKTVMQSKPRRVENENMLICILFEKNTKIVTIPSRPPAIKTNKQKAYPTYLPSMLSLRYEA